MFNKVAAGVAQLFPACFGSILRISYINLNQGSISALV
uniref:Uncharacterized protein n=1 Tax=Arundo donax TaxID=35708 RepID=A0A0A9AC97_ARUDO